MERKILYFTDKCQFSRKVISFIHQRIPQLLKDVELVDIYDKQNPEPIPRYVDRIPLLAIGYNNNVRVFTDQKLREWLIEVAKRSDGSNRPNDVGVPQPAGGLKSQNNQQQMTDPREMNSGLMEWNSSELLTSGGFSDSYSSFNPKDDGSEYQSCSNKFVSINNVDGMGKPLVMPPPPENNNSNNDNHDYNQTNRQKEKETKFQEDLAMMEAKRKATEPRKPDPKSQTFDNESFNKMWAQKNQRNHASM
jgi:hypothetical protein